MIQMYKVFLLFLLGSLYARGAELPDWRQSAVDLMERPLEVHYQTGRNQQSMKLLGVESDQLFFEFDQGGQGSMPIVNTGDNWISVVRLKAFQQAMSLVGSERFNFQELELLRREVYPMVRFVYLPTELCSFQRSVLKLAEGLVQLKQFDEAVFLIEQLEIDKLNFGFEELCIEISDTLRSEGRLEQALKLINIIPLERISLSAYQTALVMADSLRIDEAYAGAIDLYSRLQENEHASNHVARLWNDYCRLQLGEFDTDTDFPLSVKKIVAGEPQFALQQLVLGSYYMRTQQPELAMRVVSEGIVYSNPMDAWMPELMYRSAQLYEGLEFFDIANMVYQETSIFFPETIWAELSETKINQ